MPVISVHFVLWLNKHPEHVIGILTAIVEEYPHHSSSSRLRDALQRLALAAKRHAGPTWAARLPGNVPVVNRALLRDALKRLMNLNGPEVIMIDGPDRNWPQPLLVSHQSRGAII